MQRRRGKGQFIELNSILDLVFFQFGAFSGLFEKANPGRAQLISSNRRLNKYFRCKSKRQIGSLIVAAQNSIKPCIGLIGANGMQRGGVCSQPPETPSPCSSECGPQLSLGVGSTVRCGPRRQICGSKKQSEFSILTHVCEPFPREHLPPPHLLERGCPPCLHPISPPAPPIGQVSMCRLIRKVSTRQEPSLFGQTFGE